MAYQYKNSKGKKYFLHAKKVTLKGQDKERTIYFFGLAAKDGAIEELPKGFKVSEAKSGLPVLKKA